MDSTAINTAISIHTTGITTAIVTDAGGDYPTDESVSVAIVVEASGCKKVSKSMVWV